ncbi:high mobility group B protein 15-like [Forsythia ovata]|uniref:High mobility group B protein 15-like n=1 Tax=Forsythia ovata TaxID=205694 RepID=A0ABD1V2P8_9LAMI
MERGMAADSYHPYPPPLAAYEEVVGSRELFMDTLKKLHVAMGTKFMIPIVGGKDLDLHHLFVEVSSRGGITKVVKERKWKEVTAVFNFPSSATNASFILRKYYISLIYHYEQIYFFKAKCWTPLSTDALQNVSTITAPPHGLAENVLSPRNQEASPQQIINTATSLPEVTLAPSPFIPVSGVIDGKFEGGYLITVKIGSEDFKGVLYQVPHSEAQEVSQHHSGPINNMGSSSSKPGVPRRNRRKKSEMKRRDPAHPKPNRSGYNFFFAEQHSRLKPLYPGRDRDISRMIGELWNKLKEPEKSVYQEKALRDKERYRLEMEDYRERLRTGQIINNAAPIQQFSPMPDAGMIHLDKNVQIEGETSAQMAENETSSDKSNLERQEKADEDSEMGLPFQAKMEPKNVNIEISQNEEASELHTGRDVVGCQDGSVGHGQIIKNAVPMQQFPPMIDAGLMDLDKNVQIEGETSSHMAENETSSDKNNLERYEKADKDSGMGASFRAEMEIKNVNIEISPSEETFELQTGRDVVGCEDNNPGHGQIINNAVPMQQFPPMADAGLMDLDMNVQIEGDTSAYMAENETSSAKSNLEGYEKVAEDSVMGASFQAEIELKNVNIGISPNEEASDLQMGPDTVGCKDNNPGHGGMEEKKMLSTGGERNSVCVEEEMSIPVEEGEVGPINSHGSVAITMGNEKP